MLEKIYSADIFIRARDAFLMRESDPAKIQGSWHRRGCTQTQPLEVVLDEDQEIIFAVAKINYDGRTIYKCPECHRERAI